jgi:hypothetical protein
MAKEISLSVRVVALSKDSYVAFSTVGGVLIRGSRAESELTAVQSWAYKLAHDQNEPAIGIELALAGTDLETEQAQLESGDDKS